MMNGPAFFLAAALLLAVLLIRRKRKQHGITGFKSLLTPICFCSIGLVGLIDEWMDLIGLYAWLVQLTLLVAGIYFLKYIPSKK
ncbi:hypothetical protein [Domibacillus enclensis]|nr:hypothetical protein [Domibacillus enclensis]SIP97409.1 hypothetical protein SAMN05443094_101326 [Domibacillus enclensis]